MSNFKTITITYKLHLHAWTVERKKELHTLENLSGGMRMSKRVLIIRKHHLTNDKEELHTLENLSGGRRMSKRLLIKRKHHLTNGKKKKKWKHKRLMKVEVGK